jgi:hypothetical protein
MGYVHYWKVQEVEQSKWDAFVEDIKQVFSAGSYPITSEDDSDLPPRIDDTGVRFNGIDEDGHETFMIERSCTGFDFCKTARKPYDLPVCIALTLAKTHGILSELSTDGEFGEGNWLEAENVVSSVLGTHENSN